MALEVCVKGHYWSLSPYRETEGQPLHIRLVKALEKILAEMTISIQEGQLIIDNKWEWLAPNYPKFSPIGWRLAVTGV
jgi:hypothetical protein